MNKLISSIILILILIIVTKAQVPSAPTNLQLTSHTTTSAIVTWNDNSSNETGFKCEYNLGEGTWTLSSTTGANITTCTLTDSTVITRNNPIRIRIRATNGSGDSSSSNEVFDTLPPSPMPTPSTSWTDIYSLASFPTPTRPARGGVVYDPKFGAKYCRVTEQSVTNSNGTDYSYWMSINSDKTKILEYTNSGGRLHTIVPNYTFGNPCVSGSSVALPTITGDGSDGFFGGNSPMWDINNPDVLYGVGAQAIYKYVVSTNTWSLYADADPLIASGRYLVQCQAENVTNPRRFGCQIFETGNIDRGAIVFEKNVSTSATTSIYSHAEETDGYNEVTINKDGAYFIVAYGCANASNPRCNAVTIIELNNSNFEVLIQSYGVTLDSSISGVGPSHWDATETHLYGTDNTHPGLVKYTFGDHTPTSAEWLHHDLGYVPDYGSYHISTRATTSIGWYNVEYYADASGARPLDGEFTLVSMSGSPDPQIKRWAHSFTDSNDAARYFDTPRGNLSKDGSLFAFASTWGTDGTRRDLFYAWTPLSDSKCNWHTNPNCQ